MSLQLTQEDGQGYRPPLFAQAQACTAPFHNVRELPHPFAIANHSWGRIEQALDVLLNAFAAANTDSASQASHTALLEAHRQFIYANSEFAEAVLEKLPSCFVALDTKLPRAEGSQRLRQHADVICNKLKHNQNRLVISSARFSIWRVLGYSVMAHDDKGVLRPNRIIHGDHQAFSFAVDIRRILAKTYLIGAAVGVLIEKSGQPFGADHPAVTSKARELLEKVAALPRTIFPWEKTQDMPTFRWDGSTLEIRDHGGEAYRINGRCVVSVTLEGDGATNQFAML